MGHRSTIALLSLFGMTMACSSEEPTQPKDAAVDTAPPADAGSDAAGPACDLDAPFGKAVLVDYRSAADAGAIPLSGILRIDATNERFAVFDADQGGTTKIFVADRVGSGFVGADERAASSTVAHAYPALSTDGKTIYFSALVAGKNAIHRIASDAKDFTAAEVWLSDPQVHMVMPFVANDGALYFGTGPGPMRVAIDGAGKPGVPAPLPGVPVSTNGVVVNASETILYYGEGNTFDTASLHEMRKSGGTWVAKDPPIAIDGLQKVQTPTWLSPDGCRLYVQGWPNVIDRALYVAAKPKK